MSKTKSALTKPVYRPRTWGRATKPRALPSPWLGLDTERDALTGEFVCGYVASETESFSFTRLHDLPTGTYWAWNLAYDIEGMIRDLALEEGWAMRQDGARFKLGDGTACYYHGKRFEYNDSRGSRLFVDAAPFYNKQSLAEAAKIVQSEKDRVDASTMSWSKYQMDTVYREAVNKYCIQDARLVYKLVRFLNDGLAALPNPVSMGGTPGATARRFLSRLPPFPDVVWDTLRPFLGAYCGGRFEMLKRGYFPAMQEHDIVSAYPDALRKCPLLTGSAESYFTTRRSDNALYGAYLIRSFDKDGYLGLLPAWKGATRVYSAGEEKAWLCRPELDLLHDLGIDYEILRGVEITDPNAYMGFAPDMDSLFTLKDKEKGKPVAAGAKVCLNSTYGCLVQLIPKGGKWVPIDEADDTATDFAGELALMPGEAAFEGGQYTAFCYGSTLTSMVRVKLIQGALSLGLENVIATHTDSLLSMKGHLPTSAEMGAWEKKESVTEEDGGGIIFKTGQYAVGAKVKGRGFVKRRLEPWNLDEVPQRQRVDLYAERQPTRSRTGIKTASSWGEVSLIREGSHVNNLDWESKRNWIGSADARLIERREWQDSTPLSRVLA